MSKKEVGLYATMCLLKEKAPTFMSVRQELHKGVSLRKGEDWVSELQVLQEFTNRLDVHLASGKVMWRADPWTANGWQYQDQWQHKEDHFLAKESNLSSPVPLVWSQIQEQYRTKNTGQTHQFKAFHDLCRCKASSRLDHTGLQGCSQPCCPCSR